MRMGPWAKKCRWPLEAEKGKEIYSPLKSFFPITIWNLSFLSSVTPKSGWTLGQLWSLAMVEVIQCLFIGLAPSAFFLLEVGTMKVVPLYHCILRETQPHGEALKHDMPYEERDARNLVLSNMWVKNHPGGDLPVPGILADSMSNRDNSLTKPFLNIGFPDHKQNRMIILNH